ncbi:efflux transporter outer membrane subunit [Paraburkholderia rhizosphaerae]|uniref:NodT family efflux transporter outer membrane factor (OMF) lipoprotein n=1 Tax=Paraburkholderia rhizosphaerae TaxID=480658 RepID=A0A4R8LUF7_9BURK|nr:efflux transporter outer membrane subunit [Paraburkholderia rhizosphaerae]TDY50425.1 NodT family efflux transporter outer membrane factor (OMF) lipoprotein [Paraburkholderia rhizosphaerae]
MNAGGAHRHTQAGRAFARALTVRAVWVVLCVALCVAPFAGCTVGPNYSLPKDALVNAKFANAPIDGASDPLVTQQPVPPNWWRLYDDPVLNSLVEDALAENRDLKVALANLAASRAEVQFAREQDGFSGDVESSVQYTQLSPQQFLTNKITPGTFADIGFNVSYELDLFGKLRRGVEAAKADDDSVEAALDLARITVVADVVRSYVENCAAAEELAIAQHSLALERERVDVSRRLLQAGRGNQPDVTRGLTQQDTISAEIPRFLLRQRVAQYRLATLLARAPEDLPVDAKNCTKLPQIGQPVPVGDGAALLKRRPDVREAERKLAASTANIGVATAALYPTISIGASAGFTGFPKDIGTAETARYSIGPLISWVFPVNGQRAKVHQAEALTAASLAHFDSVVLNALRETQSALATYSEDTARWQALQTAAQSAQKSADETHQLYLSGRESFISDLDATRTLTSVDAQAAAARSIVAVDRVNLFLALGGGWEEAAPEGRQEGVQEGSLRSPKGAAQQAAQKRRQENAAQSARE